MLLKNGSRGEDVKRLQQVLGLAADGIFGKGTEAKVKAWQTAHGLVADGIVGDKTWGKLFASKSPAAAGSALDLTPLKGRIPDAVLAQIPDTAVKFDISSPLRLAHFLAQCGHESAGFKFVSENLNYSADGLKKVFSKYFPGNLAESYARQPQKIASRVYGGRMGNGDEASGEGYTYRGRGYIQLTGKQNYTTFDAFVEDDILGNPDLVATKYPLMSAAFFFHANGLWKVCDGGASDDVVTAVTRRVNGGTIGLADRLRHFKDFYGCLSGNS